MFKNKPLVILITIVLCAFIILLAHFQFFQARQITIKLYSEKQIVLAKQVGLSIEKFFKERLNALELIAEDIAVGREKDDNYMLEFKHIYNKIGSYANIVYINDQAQLTLSYPSKPESDLIIDIDHIKQVINDYQSKKLKQQSILCDYAILNSDKNIICIRVPVYDGEQRFKGLLLGMIDLESSLNSLITPVIKQNNVHIFILSQKGKVLYHPLHPEMIRNNIINNSGSCLNCHSNFELEKRMLVEDHGWGEKKSTEGERKLLSFTRINLPGVEWALGIDMPYNVITSANSKQFQVFFLLSASMMLVVILGSITLFKINKQKISIEKETAFLKTKTKLLENVEEAEAKYRTLVEQSPDAIAIYQKNRFVFANKKFLDLFGYSLEELNSKELFISDFIVEEAKELFEANINQILKKKKPWILFSTHAKNTHNEIRELEVSIVRFFLSGKIAYQIVLHDVTEMKIRERETTRREHLAFIGEMSTRIAHEIKNPLASLQAGIQLLESNLPTDKKTKEYFKKLTSEVLRVDRIVKGLLSYAREEQLSKKKTNLVNLVQKVVDLNKQSVGNKKIEWQVHFEGDNPEAHVDPLKFEQVIWNLIINSLQSIEKEGLIDIKIQDGFPDRISCIISDSGSGFSEMVQKKLFQPFFSTKSQGTGLGLAITKKIINAHDGTIEVSSELNKGTTVRILLPR